MTKWVIEDPTFDATQPEHYDYSRITNDRRFKTVVRGVQQAILTFWTDREPDPDILFGRCKRIEVEGMRRALVMLANSATLGEEDSQAPKG